ncbi:hypothetical protein AZG88_30045 [Rhodococcus sp. LB1]|nr:hypothetical protein AZG88_30045 [Rhodococcus sp. LB1]
MIGNQVSVDDEFVVVLADPGDRRHREHLVVRRGDEQFTLGPDAVGIAGKGAATNGERFVLGQVGPKSRFGHPQRMIVHLAQVTEPNPRRHRSILPVSSPAHRRVTLRS